jgi:hypothetical protein
VPGAGADDDGFRGPGGTVPTPASGFPHALSTMNTPTEIGRTREVRMNTPIESRDVATVTRTLTWGREVVNPSRARHVSVAVRASDPVDGVGVVDGYLACRAVQLGLVSGIADVMDRPAAAAALCWVPHVDKGRARLATRARSRYPRSSSAVVGGCTEQR